MVIASEKDVATKKVTYRNTLNAKIAKMAYVVN